MIKRFAIGTLALIVLAVTGFLGYGYVSRRGAPSFSKGGDFGPAPALGGPEATANGTRKSGGGKASGTARAAKAPQRASSTDAAPRAPKAAPSGPVRPAEGTYRFSGSGDESVRFGPTSACAWEIEDVPLTIKREGAATVFDWTYSSQRMERLLMDYRPKAVRLTFAGSAVTCVGVRRTSEEDYTPPPVWVQFPLTPGASWSQETQAGDRHERTTTTILKRTHVTVPAGTFTAYVLQTRGTLSGSEEGTFRVTHWYAPDLGLSVRKASRVSVKQGSADYESTMTLELAELP